MSAQKKRGRPTLADGDPTVLGRVRMPASEWASCQRAAEHAGAQSVAEWARGVLARAARRELSKAQPARQ